MPTNPAYNLVLSATPGLEEVIKGGANVEKTVSLVRQTVRSGSFGMETTEVYEAFKIDAVRAFVADCMANEKCSDCEFEKPQGEKFTITVTWLYDRTTDIQFGGTADWIVGSDAPLWDIEAIDTSLSIKTHPYFSRLPVDGGTAIAGEMVKIDYAIATGDQDGYEAEQSVVGKIAQRYDGLTRAGIEDWNPVIVIIKKRFRLFKSMVNDPPPATPPAVPMESYKYLLRGINRCQPLVAAPGVANAINPPADILAALNNMETIYYTDETLTPTTEFLPSNLFWVRQRPVCQLSGRNPNGPRDVTLSWIGAPLVSAVLFPPAVPVGAEPWGMYDPKGLLAP